MKNPNAPWSGTAINTDFPNPYSLQWTLGVQRELTNTLALETAFVGNRGVKLNYGPRSKPGGPADRSAQSCFRAVPLLRHLGVEPLQLLADVAQKALFPGPEFQCSLHLGEQHLLPGWGPAFAQPRRPQDNNNLALEKGPSPFDINHRFVSDFLYELPFARLADASTRGKKLLLAGWQFAGIYSAESGFPFFVSDPSGYSGARVDYAGGDPLLNDASTPLQYLNRSAFARPPINPVSGVPSRPGTLGRNALRGPGFWNIDLALSKTLAISERIRLQIRTDMINAFNHTNFVGISTNINATNFGAFTSTRGARLVQFNARLTF